MRTRVANETLAESMDRRVVVGDPSLWWREGEKLRCVACGHRCLIGQGLRGICKARFEDQGKLMVPYGYVSGLQSDPVEKKPFFHVLPGSDALTFGMLGCDLHCDYCQNWITSQALRDKNAVAPVRPVTPEQLVETARREGARLVVSSYNEPLITAEWAVGVFREAKAAGLACAFVSNGNATPEVLDYLRPWLVAYKVDLKSFQDCNYRSLGGKLDNITSTIRMIHERGLWLEIVTLVIPGFNDSEAELRDIARFLVSVSPDIPWHVTAFHKDYRMQDPDATSADTLVRAAEIGTEEGLRFIYAGNLPGRVGPWEDTRCPSCRATVIARYGYLVRGYRLSPEGRCPECQTQLPGVWPAAISEVHTGNDMAAYRSRLPRRVEMSRPTVGENSDVGRTLLSVGRTRMSGPQATGQVGVPAGEGLAMLTAEHKQRVALIAAQMVRGQVTGQAAPFPEDLADIRELPLPGAFISLKRGKHLRACTGLLGQPVPLRQALEHAAYRTVWEDARFPPISPTEVEHLDMELWLLGAPQPVAARGEARLEAIELGKHGVQVARGQARALFLPSVATENGWDARRLLDQVCMKAGIAPTAWRDDNTSLHTFEGEVFRVPLGADASYVTAARPDFFCRVDDLTTYVDSCRSNVAALLTGATPSYYLFGAADGNVSGVILLVQQPGGAEAIHFSQISLRPGVPLQATLSAHAQSTARALAGQVRSIEALNALEYGLLVLYDPVLHGTVADAHLGGLDSQHRAVLVLERNRAGLIYDPARAAEDLVAEAARRADVHHPASATVYSLEAVSTAAPVSISTVPKPVRGPATRGAAVAGSFYEADPATLAQTVDGLLADTGPAPARAAWPAAMVPHAGLRYSGKIAADVLRRIDIPDTVIVIGPKHTNLGMDWAVAPHQTWELPGGEVPSDFVLARRLAQAIPGLEMDAAAHQREHGIEVELPLLARLAPSSKVVGIVIGHGDLEACRRFAHGLADFLQERETRPLLLISSDMNHFATDAENRRLDAIALEAMETLDPARLYDTVTQNQISMCGLLPAVIVLETLRKLGNLHKAERVGYATTADVTGDTSRVVGYAGMLIG